MSRKCVYAFAKGRKRLRVSQVSVGYQQAELQKLSRNYDKCWHKKEAIKAAHFVDVNAIKDRVTAIPFCDRFHRRTFLIVSGSCTNIVKRVL